MMQKKCFRIENSVVLFVLMFLLFFGLISGQGIVELKNKGDAPEIVYVSDINNKNLNPGSCDANTSVWFLAYSNSGYATLPKISLRDDLFKLQNLNGPNPVVRNSTSCRYVGVTDYNHPSYGNVEVVNYTCTINNLCYYDDNRNQAEWIINVSICDVNGLCDFDSSRKTSLNPLYEFGFEENYLNWKNVSIGDNLNNKAEDKLIIKNYGNVDIADLEIKGSYLKASVFRTDIIYPNQFVIGKGFVEGDCLSGVYLVNNQWVSSNVNIDHGLDSEDFLEFCLMKAGGHINQEFYASKNWKIKAIPEGVE